MPHTSHDPVAPSTIGPDETIVYARAKGINLYDQKGNAFADWDASVATLPLGHAHPVIIEGRRRQEETLDFIEASARRYAFTVAIGEKRYEISPQALAHTLIGLTFPGERAHCVLEVSGATAVNAAVKLLQRARPYRRRFIGVYGGFHGRHGAALSLTSSKPVQRERYSETIPVIRVPMPRTEDDMQTIARILLREPLDDVNGIILEAIQGEGGIEAWDKKYAKKIENICKAHDIKIVFDEIQSGLWRTGKLWAYQHLGIDPDIVVAGKGLGSGSPIGVVIFKDSLSKNSRSIEQTLSLGWHAGTFPGDPAAVTAAILTLDTIQHGAVDGTPMRDRMRAMGTYLADKLSFALPHKDQDSKGYCVLKGRGLMLGIEFRTADDEPDPEWRDAVLAGLRERHIVTIPCGHPAINPTIRLLPPYSVTRGDIDMLADALHEIFA